jgi:16S rRNA (guanine527-N7)-methyltransferase
MSKIERQYINNIYFGIMGQKELFKRFLAERFGDDFDRLFGKFESFHKWLVEENAKINLISRRVNLDDIWTVHFLDSLLAIKYADFRGCAVLDFGTGGGLPGIPLAIIYDDAEITLLDSKKKKAAAVKRAAGHLELKNCRFWDLRLEEIGGGGGQFDIIVSRSVKIEPAYKPILLKLLKPGGKLVLYKSKILDDIRQFDKVAIFDAGMDGIIGERKIVVVTK